MPDDALPISELPKEMVPEHWPSARSDTPRPAWTVHGLLALPGMLLLWIVPKRIGASIAASGWLAAIAAHLLAMMLGGGMILWAEMYHWSGVALNSPMFNFDQPVVNVGQLPWSDWVRGPFAAMALWAHGSGVGAGGFARALLTLLGIEASAVLVAVAIMPWAAAGEGAGRLFGRCLRLTWWSTTLLIPLGIGWLMDPLIRPKIGLPPEWHPFDYICLSGIGLLWLSILLRSTRRHAGPAEGPAWKPGTPRCESCGYRISHLPHTTNCPECGRSLIDSLPEHRSPPAFGEAKGFINGVRAYGTTLHQVVFEPRFFSHLAIHTAHQRARTFFLLTCLINSLLVFVATFGFEGPMPPKKASLLQVVADAVTAASVCLGIQILLGGLLAALISAVSRRPMQSAGVMVFYSQSTLLMWGVGVAALPWAGYLSEAWLDHYPTNIAVTSGAVILMAIALTPFALGTYGTLRALRRAVRDTRYANA